jgi:PIN domain nuclease of toxin-antitoxin system
LKLLLDTHVWIWSLGDPRRLGRRTLRILKNQQHEIWISPISTLEALTLNEKGRIHLPGTPAEWVANATLGTKEAPYTHEVALACRQFPSDLDPSDRVLAATALIFDLTLVTADHRLLQLANIKTLANK